MNEEILKKLYESASSVFDMPNYDQFVLDMQDDTKLDTFRNSMSEHYDMPDMDQLKSDLGFVKKKEDTALPSGDGLLEPTEIDPEVLSSSLKQNLIGPGIYSGFLSEALVRGIAAGSATDESLKVMYGGKDVTDEDLSKFIKANNLIESLGVSEDMQEFNTRYEDDVAAGDSEVWAFIKNIARNPKVAAEVTLTSLAQMATGAVSSAQGLGIVAAGAGAGAATGAALGTLSGPFAPVTSTIGAFTGSIKGAMSAAGGLTETTASFTEFLKEELAGKDFTQENIRAVLADDEAKQRIINRSLARGATIAAIDFLAAGASGKATSSIKAIGKTGKALRTTASTGIESIGGATGEIAARAVAGQEMDTREILFEAVGEAPGSAITGPLGLIGQPRYKVNGGAITKKDFLNIVNTATDEELMSMNISVDNDETASDLVNSKIERAKVKNNIDPLITDQADIDVVVDKELQIKELKKKDSSSARNRIKQLESEIKEIQSKYTTEVEEIPTVVTPIVAEEVKETVGDIINRPVVLTALGGSPLDTPIRGDLYLDGEQVVVEDANGNITEIGNFDEIAETNIEDLGIEYQTQQVIVNRDGSLTIDEKSYTIQEDLPTQGLVFDQDGKVIEASVKDETGKPVMFKGTLAEEIAYQTLLNRATSPEQSQRITELLDKDEEFQNILRQATEPTQETADTDTQQVVEQAEEVEVVPQEIETEVQKLEDILKAPEVKTQVDNAVKSLSRIAPDVQFIVHETEEAYTEATNNTASGTYNPNTRVVHINKSKANARTVAHETFHAILTNFVKTDVEARKITNAMIKAVSRNAPFELKQYLNEFAADYDTNIQSEEKLAELVGELASEYNSLPTNTQSRIKQWLDNIAKLLGLKPFTDAEVIDVLNTISGKIAAGEEIAFEDVNVLGDPKTIGAKMADRFQADFKDKLSGLSFVYDKNSDRFKSLEEQGFITRDRQLADFDGDIMLLHQPDAAFSGTITKGDEVIVEGKGGMFYPIKFHEDGYFWASTSRVADKMASDLNKIYEQNNGRILMALTSAPYHKLLSSTTMSNAVLDFFTSKAVDRRFKIKKNDVRAAMIEAANKTVEINDRTTGLGLNLKKGESLEGVVSAIKEKLSVENSAFADRKMFVETLVSQMVDIINANDVSVKQFGEIFSKGIQNKYFKGITKTGKIKISATNMTQAISEMFTEPILKEGVKRDSGGQVYAILELNGKVKAVDSNQHESYPKAIQSEEGQKTVVHILKDRLDWKDSFLDFQTGQRVQKDRELRVFPTTGVSVQGLQLKVREQVSSVRGIIRDAKKNGVSDKAILEYLKQNNLDVKEGFEILDRINQEERRAKQKREGLFDPEKNVVSRFLEGVYRTFMSGRGYMPLTMQTLSEYREGSIEAEIRIARKNVKRIQDAIKKEKNPKEVISSIDRFMRGEQDHGVPESMIEMVSSMRTHLDNLSKKLVESGAIASEESKENIINNLGSYLNRSYQVFDDKNYANKITDQVKQAAKNKLREIYREYAEIESLQTGIPVEVVLERRVDRAINEILNQDEGNEFVMKSKLGAKNLTPLQQRKEIPAEIRALMGEYGDPAMNYVKSIQKVAAIIENQNFQKQLRKNGEGVYLFTEPTGIYNVKIAGDSSTSMDVLAGMYTSKEIADAMTSGNIIDLDFKKFQPLYDFYLKSVGAVKYSKTILSIGTHAKNIIGNLPFMVANGNFSFKAFNDAINVLRAEYSKNGNQELLNKMDEYTRLGIINQSTTLNEIRDLLSSGKTFEDVMIDRTSQKGWDRIYTKGKSLFGKAQKAYQVEDDFFKIAGYESEKVKYAKALFDKNPQQLNEEELKEVSDRAAAIVKNTLPNYGRVGGYVKLLKALPIAGTFISFTSESVRTSYNTIDLTVKEIANPKTRAVGINRLAGIMTLAAVKAGIIALFGMNSGDDEDESLEQARKFLPFWDTYSTIAPTEIKDGVFKYRSISASDPHGYMTRVFNAYYSSDNFREGLINALGEAAEPWTSTDIFTGQIAEMLANRDRNGRQIFKEGDTSEEITEKVLSRLWKTYEPGTITSAKKIAKSENPGNETLGQFTGFKEHSVEILDVLGYKAYDIQKRAIESASDYSRARRHYNRGEITIEDLKEVYNRSNEKKKEVYREAIEYYEGALYFGLDKGEVQKKMMDSGIPRYIMIGIVKGEIPNMKS